MAEFTNEADKVVPALVKAMGDPDTGARINALESLKPYGDKAKPAAPAAREMLQYDPNGRIRQRAAALLERSRTRMKSPSRDQGAGRPRPRRSTGGHRGLAGSHLASPRDRSSTSCCWAGP